MFYLLTELTNHCHFWCIFPCTRRWTRST